MNRLARLIETLRPEELLLLQKDLDSGTMERLIARRLAEHATRTEKACPTCGARLSPRAALRLEFGPPDLRQQAFFDAPDCLQFFIQARIQKQKPTQ